ncbi:putative MFS family arabinose efflux permease [Actinocorallia herbida]|uniref:Putative MFS family arabinose efflux permease n=1 Tax=Actinocorallia herbida TaxID=58109 RepID=A0A3N1DCZ8_9ACTN|nr:MFS transporter [Actinocorallia herbida]ROO91018.1 putative MFS family arabinose efflux permease [Actinocorallia herbida]
MTSTVPDAPTTEEDRQPTPGEGTAPAGRSVWITLIALALAGSVVSIQQTLVIPLLPTISATFDVAVTDVTWLFTASLLAGAVATPLLSRFGDMYGKKPMMLLTLGLLAAGSVICALSADLGVLIFGRAVQGVSAAMIPLAIGTIRDTFPRERVMSAIGIVSATLGVGGAVGMLITGLISSHTPDHHPVFWVAAGAAVLAFALVVLVVPNGGVRHGGRPDLAGAALLAVVLVCLLLAISQGNSWGWTSPRVLGLFAAALVLGAGWVVLETKVAEPLVRMSILIGRKSLSANIASVFLGFSMYGSFTLIAALVQASPEKVGYGLGGTVLTVGLVALPNTVAMVGASFLCGRLAARIGAAYTLALGSAVAGASYLTLALWHSTVRDFLIFNFLQGLGFGIAYASIGTLAVQHVPMDSSGIASGINVLVRTAGGSVSAAIGAAILTGGGLVPTIGDYVLCLYIVLGGSVGAAVVAAVHGLRHRD